MPAGRYTPAYTATPPLTPEEEAALAAAATPPETAGGSYQATPPPQTTYPLQAAGPDEPQPLPSTPPPVEPGMYSPTVLPSPLPPPGDGTEIPVRGVSDPRVFPTEPQQHFTVDPGAVLGRMEQQRVGGTGPYQYAAPIAASDLDVPPLHVRLQAQMRGLFGGGDVYSDGLTPRRIGREG